MKEERESCCWDSSSTKLQKTKEVTFKISEDIESFVKSHFRGVFLKFYLKGGDKAR